MNANPEGIVIGSLKVSNESCTQLRRALQTYAWAPNDFRFFKCSGWPIDTSIEDKMHVTDCITNGAVMIQTKHKGYKFKISDVRKTICKEAFYCEQRKKSIVIKHGDFQIDSMILNLYPEPEMIDSENLECLTFKVDEKLKFDSEDSYRNNIMLSVSKLRNVVNTDATVYVIGGTNKISQKAKLFCMTLGNELGKVKGLSLATEGFFGTGQLVAKNFREEQGIRYRSQIPKLYHILPIKDTEDYSDKANQTDGLFEKLPYGNTLFYGMSVLKRDDIVAAAFKVCILIEGGQRSACLAEKFLWNECQVVAVPFNNIAIKSKRCLRESLAEIPNGVERSDWRTMNEELTSLEEAALCVKRIVCALLHLEC